MQKTDYVIGSKAMFWAVYSLDLEGIIAKRRADPYRAELFKRYE